LDAKLVKTMSSSGDLDVWHPVDRQLMEYDLFAAGLRDIARNPHRKIRHSIICPVHSEFRSSVVIRKTNFSGFGSEWYAPWESLIWEVSIFKSECANRIFYSLRLHLKRLRLDCKRLLRPRDNLSELLIPETRDNALQTFHAISRASDTPSLNTTLCNLLTVSTSLKETCRAAKSTWLLPIFLKTENCQ
jgi:hypothetical protein